MLNPSLTAIQRGEVPVRGQVPPDDPLWDGAGVKPAEPLELDLIARSVGEGVLVRGRIRGELVLDCRRCLAQVPAQIEDTIDLLYEPLEGEEEAELEGEVYPLPERGDALDLRPALREELLLRIPEYVVCSETCRGLCPQCGANLNQGSCACIPEAEPSPWEALKKLKFD